MQLPLLKGGIGMLQVRGAIIAGLILALPTFAQAQAQLNVAAGTRVGLRFINRLDAAAATQDQRVDLRVASHVIVNRRIAIREGTGAHGVIAKVIHDAVSGSEQRTRIAFIETTAVDGSTVRLARIEIFPVVLRQVNDPLAALSTTAVGSILVLNSIPTASLFREGRVIIPAGAVAVTVTTHSLQIKTE